MILDVVVSGAGSTEINGVYRPTKYLNAKLFYQKVDDATKLIEYYNDFGYNLWKIVQIIGYDIVTCYECYEDVTTPDLCINWETLDGSLPAPTVSKAVSDAPLNSAYNAIIATIVVSSDATEIIKSMVKSTLWRLGTSGEWNSADCTLTAGNTYQFKTYITSMGSSSMAILPNIKSYVTIDWDITEEKIYTVGNYFMYAYANKCPNLVTLSVPDTSGLLIVGDYFMGFYAGECTGLTNLSAPDVSGLTSAGSNFMSYYAYGCANLTTLSVPYTPGLENIGSHFMYAYAYGCHKLKILSAPDVSGLTSVGDYFMTFYAYNCSDLKTIFIPDTSGLTGVGLFFMSAYAANTFSLTSLILPLTTGWFKDHDVSWTVPESRLGYLYGYVQNETSQTAWRDLTVYGKTLYMNYIQSEGCVLVFEEVIRRLDTSLLTSVRLTAYIKDYINESSFLLYKLMTTSYLTNKINKKSFTIDGVRSVSNLHTDDT